MRYYCSYCEYYGDEFVGSYQEVSEHVLEHPINVTPLPESDAVWFTFWDIVSVAGRTDK